MSEQGDGKAMDVKERLPGRLQAQAKGAAYPSLETTHINKPHSA